MGKKIAVLVSSLLFISYLANAKEYEMPGLNDALERLSGDARECVVCHADHDPGKVRDWLNSGHASSGISCIVCHQADPEDADAGNCPGTADNPSLFITTIVTPNDCGMCHPGQLEEFESSKHARTWEIQTVEIRDPWLKGMNSDIERATGCYVCHGSDISSGEMTSHNWPNEGCGRKNPDGSFGSCAMCHTFHRFSKAEARKPDTCGQCHLGPDHPQNEIYYESKHGKRYMAEGDEWDFDADDTQWKPGLEYTAPTCAVCHMSSVGDLSMTHDVGERLKWEAQAPLTVMNKDHNGDEEREKMIQVCTQCHSPRWATNYLDRYDEAVHHYNENYFKPVKSLMDGLYEKELLTIWPVFDEELEWAYYEYWHHEGRRARMGSAMMGPDYSWWHGFYDLKKKYQEIITLAAEVEENGHGSPVFVPGSGGENLTPDDVEALPDMWKKIDHLKSAPR